MSRMRDRRQSILEAALENPSLTAREKLFMLVVCTLAAEYSDGQRRYGSKSMGPDGKFSLHLDYLARATHMSAENTKKLRQSLTKKTVLQLVHSATHGRPATWQAFAVRGDETYRLTWRQIVPPYEVEEPTTRGDVASPLTYKTPTHRDHAPAVCVVRNATPTVQSGSKEEGCRFHEWSACPEDCANHPDNRRRSA